MSMSVCLSVREDISGTTRTIFTKFFAHDSDIRGSVLLWRVDVINTPEEDRANSA